MGAKRCAHDGCQSPSSLVRDNGYCWAHGPGAKERLKRMGQRGGETMRRRLQKGHVPSSQLPALRDHDSAKTWLETIGRAVAAGQLEPQAARAGIVAVEAWLRAHVGEVEMQLFEELKADVEALKRRVRAA